MDHPDDARLSPGRRPPALSGLRQILPAVIPAALVGVGYQCGAETLRLQFSRDFRGMLWVMPAAMLASVLLMAVTIRTR